MDECRLDDLVGKLEGVALFLLHLSPKAGGTADVVGRKVLGAVDGAEIVLSEHSVLFEVLPLSEVNERRP